MRLVVEHVIYIGEDKPVVLTTFRGPSVAYKLNYSRYCFRRCLYYYLYRYFSPYTTRTNLATAYTNLAATAYINLATTYYSPPYYRPVRY